MEIEWGQVNECKSIALVRVNPLEPTFGCEAGGRCSGGCWSVKRKDGFGSKA
jgi:hypothetical protein